MTDPPDAFALISRMLQRSYGDTPSFPPTELFSEGWMMRLILEAGFTGAATLPFTVAEGARWYSEARLASAFLPRFRGDQLAEGYTHADGLVGHFEFRADTTAGVTLPVGATQFVVIEAKMGSKLAAGTTKATWFDQAARNVAAMAWTAHRAGLSVDRFTSLGFFVFAPAERLTAEPSFHTYTSKTSIADKVLQRIALYGDDIAATARLQDFADSLPAFLDAIDIRCVSWEDLLAGVDGTLRPALEEFYTACLRHNPVVSA